MTQTPEWIWAAAAASLGLLVGALASKWQASLAARQRKRIPKRWPLHTRVMANSEERKVWGWLHKVFYDHHIMIKSPVTRFTLPRARTSGEHWYQLLSGVYCTFTICAADGHVIGCVDVLGDKGLPKRNRQLKQTLLSQCGMAYCVVNYDSLPTTEEIRLEFLGEAAPISCDQENNRASISAARLKLRTAINRQRHMRPSDFSPLTPDRENTATHTADRGRLDSEIDANAWQQNNSFLAPLDSRRAELP